VEDLFADGIDIAWCTGQLHDFPTLIIHGTGPLVASEWLVREVTRLKVGWVYDNNRLPDFVPTTFICYEEANIATPILAADPADDGGQAAICEAHRTGAPWIFVVQFAVDGKPMKRVWLTERGETSPVPGPDGSVASEGWFVEL
jgi:hypothetical protein